MLPVVHPDGAATAKRIVACSVLLVPVSLLPRFLGMTGSIYSLLASVLYLPALFAVMVFDRPLP
jgi:protoheme IX farnesyltransferase